MQPTGLLLEHSTHRAAGVREGERKRSWERAEAEAQRDGLSIAARCCRGKKEFNISLLKQSSDLLFVAGTSVKRVPVGLVQHGGRLFGRRNSGLQQRCTHQFDFQA
jgi:hypothetical protein